MWLPVSTSPTKTWKPSKYMKRIGLALLGLLVLGWTAGAQTSREELLSHMELTAGNYANYPVPTGHLTPAMTQ